MKSRVSSTRVNTNIVQGKISCAECNEIMHQKVNQKARIDLFICKNKDCKNTVNRSWLFKMIRLAIEQHVNKGYIDNKIYENEILRIQKELEESSNNIEKKKAVKLRLYIDKAEIISSIDRSAYDQALKEKENDLTKLKSKHSKLAEQLQSIKDGFNSRRKNFSKSLDKFKLEIKDILHSVQINKDEAIINIHGWRIYDIPKPNNTHLAWNKREENKFDIYSLPLCRYDTGDENLDMLVHQEINPNYENELDEYFQSEDYKSKIKGVSSLGSN
ncbi:hypothetical protein [Formosa sp. L2A11]|uniref:hypothetical protein n=1 Tax=Formosa sp. L2A11 TaxID=2686363 RepID=UPI00131ADF26|nr:hypothetical protein [Formosa sp. L2A11]